MGGSHILVVDDDASIRALVETTLTLEGLDVVAVPDGAAALRHLAEHRVDVVLLDRRMPGMDGLEVLARIRADPATATVPVLLVTAVDDHGAAVEALDRGADDYVAKPFDPAELAARVRRHLRGQQAWAERLTDAVARRRAVLASAAADAGGAATLAEAARALCEALAGEPDVTGVQIVELTGQRPEPLAGVGPPALELLRRSGATEHVDAIRRGLPGGPVPAALAEHLVGAAPVRDGAGALAVVLVTGVPDAHASSADGLLALAIDAAAVARGVLSEPLRASHRRLAAQQRLRRLVESGAFAPVFQPIIDLTTDEIVGHEALTRFDDGLAPGEVFGSAIRLGVARELEEATLAAAVASARHQPDGCWLALNVTPSFVLGPAELDDILQQAHRADIVLEISEMERVGDYRALHAAIDGLGAAVQISVDDAGSGFATLDHILALEARYVKLDRSWVQGLDQDPAKRALVAGLQRFAVETGASVIAEGIETTEQLAAVRELGVAYGQGWLLGMPAAL